MRYGYFVPVNIVFQSGWETSTRPQSVQIPVPPYLLYWNFSVIFECMLSRQIECAWFHGF